MVFDLVAWWLLMACTSAKISFFRSLVVRVLLPAGAMHHRFRTQLQW